MVAALHAVHSQNTPENALLMTGLQRLSSLAQDLKIEVAPLLEYAAQVLSHSDLCVGHWHPCWHVMHACMPCDPECMCEGAWREHAGVYV